ncbi:hypothetical protein BX070DRAFT_49374 [Coemansia spiralis]|nr:hypothetical protein BX070DRAFT_49374 [Coemansia spiralis]
MELLHARIAQLEKEREEKEKAERRSKPPENRWGSQIRSYVLQPYKMVKDSRSGYTSAKINSILKGDIEEPLKFQLKALYRNST